MFTRVCREGNGCRYAASVGRKSFTRYHSSGGEIDFVRWSATENHRALLQTVCCKSCLGIAQQPITAPKQYCTSLLIFSVRFNGHFSSLTWVSQYQNVSILDFFGAVDDGSMFRGLVKSSPPANQHPAFYRPDTLPVAQPTVSKQ